MNQAFSFIYNCFQKFIAFYLSAEIIQDSGVTLLGLVIVAFVFSVLLKFVLAVPHTYNGSHDVSHYTDGDGIDHYQFRKGRWK